MNKWYATQDPRSGNVVAWEATGNTMQIKQACHGRHGFTPDDYILGDSKELAIANWEKHEANPPKVSEFHFPVGATMVHSGGLDIVRA